MITMTKRFYSFLIIAVFCGLFFLKSPAFNVVLDPPLPYCKKTIFHGLKDTPSGLEFSCAKTFLSQKLLDPTLACFKKAELLAINPEETSIASYGYLYTLFIAKKYSVIESLYKEGYLNKIDPKSPYFYDAALIFYRALLEKKTPFLLSQIRTIVSQNPVFAKKIALFEKITLNAIEQEPSLEKEALLFHTYSKSPRLAFFLNLLIPGSGYAYLKQYQSSLTCVLLFSLLIFSVWNLFKTAQTAAGILCATVFVGFYWGSLLGVQEAANFYNETLYTMIFEPLLKEQGAFPEMMIDYVP